MKVDKIPIDYEVFAKLLDDRNLSINKASKIIHAGNELFNAKKTGEIPAVFTYAIEDEFGMKYEEYAPDKQEIHTADEPQQYEFSDEMWARLEDTIVAAIKRALNE